MMPDGKIKNSRELEFAVFCIENVAAKLGVGAERVYQAFTEKSDILNGYIVPEYEVLHTQSREYIVDDLLDVMKERGVENSNTEEKMVLFQNMIMMKVPYPLVTKLLFSLKYKVSIRFTVKFFFYLFQKSKIMRWIPSLLFFGK